MINKIRKFESGATRDMSEGKFDYEGFLSPIVLEEFGRYMNQHRKQTDGKTRDSDNWQKGMPKQVYVKSLIRHVFTLWKIHRGYDCFDARDGHKITIIEALMAIFFNTQGYALEELKYTFQKNTK